MLVSKFLKDKRSSVPQQDSNCPCSSNRHASCYANSVTSQLILSQGMPDGAIPGKSRNLYSGQRQSVSNSSYRPRASNWAPQVGNEQDAKYPVAKRTKPRTEVPAALQSVFSQTPFVFRDDDASPRASGKSHVSPIFSHGAKQCAAARSSRAFHENKKQKERSALAEFMKQNSSFDLEAPNESYSSGLVQDADITFGSAMSMPSSCRTSNRSTDRGNDKYKQDLDEMSPWFLARQRQREHDEERLKKGNTSLDHSKYHNFAANLSYSATEHSFAAARASTPGHGSSTSTPASTKPAADGFSSKANFGGVPAADKFGAGLPFLRRNLPSPQRTNVAASSFAALAPNDSGFVIPQALSHDQRSRRRKRKLDRQSVQNPFDDTRPAGGFLQSSHFHQQMSKGADGRTRCDCLQKQLDALNSTQQFDAPARASKFPRTDARNGRNTSVEAPPRVVQSATVVPAPQVANQGTRISEIEQGYAVGDRVVVLRTSGKRDAGWMVQSVSADGVLCAKDVLSKLIPMNEVPNYLKPENPPIFHHGDVVSSRFDGSRGKVVSVSAAGVVHVYWTGTKEKKRFAKEALARSLANMSRRLALPAPTSKPANLGQRQPAHAATRAQEQQSSSTSSSSLFAHERPRPRMELARKELAQPPIVYANARDRFEHMKSARSASALQHRSQADSRQHARGHGPGRGRGHGPAAGGAEQFGLQTGTGFDARVQLLDVAWSASTTALARRAPAPPRVGQESPKPLAADSAPPPSRLARRRAPVLHSLDAEAWQQPPLAQHDHIRQSVANALLARRVSASKPESKVNGRRLLPEEERASQKRQQAVVEGPKDPPMKLQKATKGSPNRVFIDMTQSESSSSSDGGGDSSDEEPNHFCCPISCEIMKDPVVAEDGQTYERAALQMWFASGKNTSPLTQAKISPTVMIPNIALKSMILGWHTKRRQRKSVKANSRQEKESS